MCVRMHDHVHTCTHMQKNLGVEKFATHQQSLIIKL